MVSVHVRRGDYLRNSANHFNLPAAWYREALARFPGHVVLVVSDDIAWCREQPVFSGDRFYFSTARGGRIVAPDGRRGSANRDHWRDLCLQTLCDANIIANSSFSWWGAWLNEHPGRVVVAPDPATRWFGPAKAHFDCADLLPDTWVRL